MALTQENRLLELTTPLGKDKLLLESLDGEERILGLFRFNLELLSEAKDIDFADIVGKAVTVKLRKAGGERVIHGVVCDFEQGGIEREAEVDYYRYRATVVPWLWNLTQAADCRIFQDKTVPQIIEAVFSGRGFGDYRMSLSGSYSPRTYCVQYRESDFDFVSRLMEEEGIFYFFEHSASRHTLVLGEAPGAHAACPGTSSLPYAPEAGRRGKLNVLSFVQRHAVGPAKVVLRGLFNYEDPNVDLTAEAASQVRIGRNDKLAVYDYPAPYTKLADGDHYARRRIEIAEARHAVAEGASDCPDLTAGFKLSLTGHFRGEYNREYLLTAVRHHAVNNLLRDASAADYDNAFRCIPASAPFRPERVTPRPRMHGAQTAKVVGPSGEEIYTDKYGRIKVQFPWDRNGRNNENSSCWLRVAQVWAGAGWGGMMLPRVGQGVVVDFLDGDPDQPLVVGRVYNATAMPPYGLPDNRTQSGIKSRSTAQGDAETFNELRFEDKKGSELIYFHAEKDFHRVVQNNDRLEVGDDAAEDGSQTIVIKKNRTATVKEGDETVTIEQGNRTVTVKQGDDLHEVKAGKRTVRVEGDDSHEVNTGHRTVTVKTGNSTLSVKTGNRSVSVDTGNDELTVKMGNQTTKASLGKVTIEAMQGIELKVGGNSIKIDQSGVTISGIVVKVQGSAQTQIKGAMVQVNGDGMLTLKGAITLIG